MHTLHAWQWTGTPGACQLPTLVLIHSYCTALLNTHGEGTACQGGCDGSLPAPLLSESLFESSNSSRSSSSMCGNWLSFMHDVRLGGVGLRAHCWGQRSGWRGSGSKTGCCSMCTATTSPASACTIETGAQPALMLQMNKEFNSDSIAGWGRVSPGNCNIKEFPSCMSS